MWEAPEQRLGHRHCSILAVNDFFYKDKGGTEKLESASGLISILTLTRWCHCLSCGWESGSLGCLACPQQTGRHRDIRGGQAGKSPQVGRKKRLSPSLQAGGTGAWLLGEWLMCKLGLAGRSRPLAGCPSMACSQEHVTLEGRTKSGASLQVIQTGCRRG